VLSWLGIVWDLRTPPRHIRDGYRAPQTAAGAVPPRVAAQRLEH